MEEKMKKEKIALGIGQADDTCGIKLDLDQVESMWFWENDHRKSSAVFVQMKDHTKENWATTKTPSLTKLIREKGVRFYTCDDDYEDGDDYRYGYYYNPSNKDALDFEPLDQMEGDGHIHLFVREEGKYKPV